MGTSPDSRTHLERQADAEGKGETKGKGEGGPKKRFLAARLVRFILLGTAAYSVLALIVLAIDKREVAHLYRYGFSAEAEIRSVQGSDMVLSFLEIGGTRITSDVTLPEGMYVSAGEKLEVRYSLATPETYVIANGLKVSMEAFRWDIAKLAAVAIVSVILVLLLGGITSKRMWAAYKTRPREAFRGR